MIDSEQLTRLEALMSLCQSRGVSALSIEGVTMSFHEPMMSTAPQAPKHPTVEDQEADLYWSADGT